MLFSFFEDYQPSVGRYQHHPSALPLVDNDKLRLGHFSYLVEPHSMIVNCSAQLTITYNLLFPALII